MLGLLFASSARADITLTFGAYNNGEINFAGDGNGTAGSGTGANITFTPTTGPNFNITGSSNGTGPGSADGLLGSVTTTSGFSYTGTGSTAALSGTGTLTISDGTNTLTGNLTGQEIAISISAGQINPYEVVNLTGVTYSGTNADLQALATAGGGNGVVAITFNFANLINITLGTLADQPLTTTSFAGTISASGVNITSVPEPSSFAIAGLGALGMIGYGLRRRKAQGA